MSDDQPSHDVTTTDENRRRFLAACGRFAVVTPPTMTMLLSTSLTSSAMARSGGVSKHELRHQARELREQARELRQRARELRRAARD